ncbi:hypothetical protein Geu3261_0446_002 [Komagataeibacter europaeus NBRC 3261]|uniref:Uncharacterized protein n=2 Tax=Komagataeibacter europaeus TaxID=33995 RepID=A0A0D6Q561_KOMEU|nr:hypothetical protein Geu3261_0446_002 [Komagataeibacter europaeus NBRC 3261]
MEEVRIQTDDLMEVTRTVAKLAHGRIADGRLDLNVLLDQANDNMEMAFVAYGDGNMAFAAASAAQAASCALLVAVTLRRVSKDIPPVQEMN